MKRSKIIKIIADTICHDSFAYNPKWKWSALPEIVRIEYSLVLPTLKLWEKNGFITLLEDKEYIFIVHPEKLPNKDELINLFKDI